MNKVSKVIIMTLAVIGALGVFGAVLAAIDSDNGNYRGDDVEVKVQQDFEDRWSDEISPAEKAAFMSECDTNGQRDYCQCTFNYLDARLTPAEFRSLGNNLDNEVPDVFWDAIENCIHLYNY